MRLGNMVEGTLKPYVVNPTQVYDKVGHPVFEAEISISARYVHLFEALEIMGPGYRTFAGMMICLFFAVALMILSLLAYIFNSWFTLALVTSVPFASLFR